MRRLALFLALLLSGTAAEADTLNSYLFARTYCQARIRGVDHRIAAAVAARDSVMVEVSFWRWLIVNGERVRSDHWLVAQEIEETCPWLLDR